jgi:Tol biopolymer transport system component/DNA-binding winged helix-turn-helix (wHTH) protein
MQEQASPRRVRIGPVELDPKSGDIWKNGVRSRLPEQPLAVLNALLETPGEVVSRDELQKRLWPADTFVDFEHGLNAAVKRLRDAFADNVDSPQFIETIPRRGYRLIAPTDHHPKAVAAWPAVSPRWLPLSARSLRLFAELTLLLFAAIPYFRTAGGHATELLHLTTLAGDEMRPGLSPDGSQIVFFWGGEKGNDGGLHILMVGSPEIRRLTISPNHDNFARWSPDGRQIAFVRFNFREYAGGRVHTVSPLGGPDPRLSDFPARGPLAWSPDGRYIAASRFAPDDSGEPTGVFLIPIAGGTPRPLTDTRAPFRDSGLAFSPDGQQLAYASCTPSCHVYLMALDVALTSVGPPKRLTTDGLSHVDGLAWTRDGKSVVYDSSIGSFTYLARGGLTSLSRVSTDGSGPPQRIELAGLNAFAPATAGSVDRLVFSRHSGDRDVYKWASGGTTEPVVASSLPDADPAFSPDGTRIAYASARSGKAAEIWVSASDGTSAQRLVAGPGRWQTSPQWSPDGRRIAFDSLETDGRFQIWIVDASGGVPHRLTMQSGSQRFPTWSNDGRWVYYSLSERGEWDIWRVPATGGAPGRLTRTGNVMKAYELPDGKRLVYQTTFPGAWEVSVEGPLWVVPVEGGRPAEQLVGCALMGSLSVGPAGVYYGSCEFRTARGGTAIQSVDIDSREKHYLGGLDGFTVGHGMAVSPDGQEILYVRHRGFGADVFLIENFR